MTITVSKLQARLLAGSPPPKQTIDTNSNVHLPVAKVVLNAPGLSQKKEFWGQQVVITESKLKCVQGVSCVTQLSCEKPVTNVTNAVQILPVGARLQTFWQTWLDLGAGPKVVQILKEGYTLPICIRPNLARSPNIIICYVNPHKNLYLTWWRHYISLWTKTQ